MTAHGRPGDGWADLDRPARTATLIDESRALQAQSVLHRVRASHARQELYDLIAAVRNTAHVTVLRFAYLRRTVSNWDGSASMLVGRPNTGITTTTRPDSTRSTSPAQPA